MGLLILLGVFAVCVVIGVPVAFALAIAAVTGFFVEGLPLVIAFQRIISGINVFSLMAIPFFIFAGELMFHGGIAIRLVRFASAAIGWVRGGLGVVNVFSALPGRGRPRRPDVHLSCCHRIPDCSPARIRRRGVSGLSRPLH